MIRKSQDSINNTLFDCGQDTKCTNHFFLHGTIFINHKYILLSTLRNKALF